jgi:hypothetical protein
MSDFRLKVEAAIASEKGQALRRDVEQAVLRYADFITETSGVAVTVTLTPQPEQPVDPSTISLWSPIKRSTH